MVLPSQRSRSAWGKISGTVWRAGFFSGAGLTTFVFAFAWVFGFGFGTLAWALGFVGAATLRDGLAFSTGAFVNATALAALRLPTVNADRGIW